MPRDERASGDRVGLTPSPGDPALRPILGGGDLRVLGLLAGSSNGTFLVEVRGGDGATLAVYKPREGETPLWDFPEGTLWRREIAAYELAAAAGWPDVPLTVEGDGPMGVGAIQAFVEHDPERHYFLLRRGREEAFMRVALFDAIVNNADRKAGHCLLGPDDRIWLIDHGTCFSVESKLRTVIWEFAGRAIPAPLAGEVGRVAGLLRSGPLRRRLESLLSHDEVDAATGRAEALVRSGRFPEPGPDRHVPWPPI